MNYNEFLDSVLDKLENIKSFAGKIKFAGENLVRIGSGTGRVVYDIDGTKVLKLAKNPKGVAQNAEEARIGKYDDTKHITTRVFESSDDDTWLIAEKGKKVNEKRIKELTGIPNLFQLKLYLINFEADNNGQRIIFGQDNDIKTQMDDNEFVIDLVNFASNYSQVIGDMAKACSYGEVVRDGQPSIVLTDYGLSDEVYNTHYNPTRKQNRPIYELYNFQDGNDDILSDMNNTREVRHSMWGLMPYNVSDGDAVVNENFIKFVLKHSKYPKDKIFENTPYILDKFHECINNINEVLSHVDNKKQFYNNLLELQDYLIRGKFFNQDPLIKEEIEINEDNSPSVGSQRLDEPYVDKIANEFVDKMNLKITKHFGGGDNGYAYLIGDKVLKITTDACEVVSGLKIQQVRPKTLAYVEKIYKIFDTEANISVYGLIEDYVADKPKDKLTQLAQLDNDLNGNLMYILIKGKGAKGTEFEGKTLDDFPELAKKYLSNPNPLAKEAYDYMMGLYAIKKDLQKLDIKSNDYSNLENLGYLNGVLTYFDIGGCRVPEPSIPDNQVVELPESVDVEIKENDSIDEVFDQEDIDNFNKIAQQISKKLNVTPKFLRVGSQGAAYNIGENKILKITNDKSEAIESQKLLGKDLKHIANIYKVFHISVLDGLEYWGVVLEKLVTNKKYFEKMWHRLYVAFTEIIKRDIYSTLDDAGRIRSKGYDNIITKYLSTNPEDKKFYDGLVDISHELHENNINTLDYTNMPNLGYKKDGTLACFDLGGEYPGSFGSKPEEIEVNENISINEHLDRKIGDRIAFEVAKKYNLNTPNYIDKGGYGIAYDIGDDKVLKITSDKSEAVETSELIGRNFKHIADIYNVFTIKSANNGEHYGIVLEKLKTFPNYFNKMKIKLDNAFDNIVGYYLFDVIDTLAENGVYDSEIEDKINEYLSKNPEDRNYFNIMLELVKEIKDNDVNSDEYYNPKNLGYKKNGNLAVFDLGFSDSDNFSSKPEEIEVAEDGSSSFSTINSIGNDNYPIYNQNDSSPSIDNNIPRNVNERNKSYMPNSSAVTVKKKCRLGGLGNTSTACNQGDVKNLMLRPIYEDDVEEGVGDKFVEKKFGIKPEFNDFEKQYQQNIENNKVVVDLKTGRKLIKNPKSLNTVDTDARGVIDTEGNLYIQVDGQNVHTYLLDVLIRKGIVNDDKDWYYALPKSFVTVTRDGDTNTFYLGESNKQMIDIDRNEFPDYYKDILVDYNDAKPVFQKFLDRAKAKNPKFNFLNINILEKNDTNEGVGDKFVEKKYGMKSEFDDFEKQYQLNIENNKLIVVGDIELAVNPKSLNGINANVRGVVDTNGNLYIEQTQDNLHYKLIDVLVRKGIIGNQNDWEYDIPKNFITIIRDGNSNIFYLGESNKQMMLSDRTQNMWYWENIADYNDVKPVFQNFLDKAKTKNPKYNFMNVNILDKETN